MRIAGNHDLRLKPAWFHLEIGGQMGGLSPQGYLERNLARRSTPDSFFHHFAA